MLTHVFHQNVVSFLFHYRSNSLVHLIYQLCMLGFHLWRKAVHNTFMELSLTVIEGANFLSSQSF